MFKKLSKNINLKVFFALKRYFSFFLYLAVAFILTSYTFGWIEKTRNHQEDFSVFTDSTFLVTFFFSVFFFLCYFVSQIIFISKLKLKKLNQYFIWIFIFFIFMFIIEIFLFSAKNLNDVILSIAAFFTIIFALVCIVSDSLIIVILLKIQNKTIAEPSKYKALYIYDEEDNRTVEENWTKIKNKIENLKDVSEPKE
ncbi:hypothetical protein JTY60_01225 [symbiont of Argiope bruennichi]|uniref:hypothetical protein n=1 Tax=symbiont of Argiope bruennichi TaxID=2810479 RepID=UPI003DA352F0